MQDNLNSSPQSDYNGQEPSATIETRLATSTYRKLFTLAVLIVLSIQLIGWVFTSLRGFLLVLLLAWLLAISIDPAVSWLSKHGMRRGMGTGLVLFGILISSLVFLFLMGRALVEQVSELWAQLPILFEEAALWIDRNMGDYISTEGLGDSLAGFMQPDTGFSALSGGVFGIFTSASAVLFSSVAVLVFAFYFAADRPRWEGWIASWLKPAHQKIFVEVADISIMKAGGFVLSKIVLAFLSSVAHVIFFWFLDVPFWLPMGIFAGVTSQFIPIVGTYLGVIVPAFFVVFTEPLDVVWIVIFATIYQQLENYVFTPKISSKAMDINSGIALGSVFVGVALFGPVGALVGIPLVAMVFAIVSTYGKRYELLPEVEARVVKDAVSKSTGVEEEKKEE